jgi:hypothetical protein
MAFGAEGAALTRTATVHVCWPSITAVFITAVLALSAPIPGTDEAHLPLAMCVRLKPRIDRHSERNCLSY